MDLRLLRYFVAIAEERHFGRAAARLHMTQPPLSRAIKQLETELGVVLLHRSAAGVALTAGGKTLYAEASALLAHADQARARVTAAARDVTLTIGTLGDGGAAASRLATTFRRLHPSVAIRFHESDFSDPTAGLRTGVADVAFTRQPFDETGITLRELRADPVGVVLRREDPLADRGTLSLTDVAERPWFQLPEGTDPLWRAYWNGAAPVGHRPAGPVVRTVTECMQAVLWNGTVGIAPLTHTLPDGLVWVPVTDMPPSRLVVAWPSSQKDALIRSFAQIAVDLYLVAGQSLKTLPGKARQAARWRPDPARLHDPAQAARMALRSIARRIHTLGEEIGTLDALNCPHWSRRAVSGREDRFTDPLVDDMPDLVAAITAVLLPILDRPYLVFGHSMGSAVAYETVQRPRCCGVEQPAWLLVSGRPVPGDAEGGGQVHRRDGDGLAAELARLGGTPADVLEGPAVAPSGAALGPQRLPSDRNLPAGARPAADLSDSCPAGSRIRS